MIDLSWLAPTMLAGGVLWKQITDARLASRKLDDIGRKVDGATTALIEKVDSLRSDKEALKDEVSRLDTAGAASTNDSPGPVSIDAAGQVNVKGEDRRR